MSNPFSMDFVMKTTIRHMRKCIDLSIDKTLTRLPEFVGDPDKSVEVFKTLSILQNMRKQIEHFQIQNSRERKGAKNV